MEKIDILIGDERHEAVVTEYPAKGKRPKRYEIEIEKGISINDHDPHGDNLLYAWIFPANSLHSAIDEFIRRVRLERLGLPWK